MIPDGFHPFAAGLKGTALLGRPAHFKILWGPLTLGGDCFHYHINDDDSPSAANPSTARRGQAEVRAIQLLKQNAVASGEGRSTCRSCSAMPQSHRFNRQSLVWGHRRGQSKYQSWHTLHSQVLGTAGGAGETFYTSLQRRDGECFKPYQPAMDQNRSRIWDALLLLVDLVKEAEHSSWIAGYTVVRPAQVLVVPDLTHSLTLIIRRHPTGETATQSYPWPLFQGEVGLKPEGISCLLCISW